MSTYETLLSASPSGVGGVGLLTAALIWLVVPATSATSSSPLVELGALRRPQVWLTLGVAAVGSGGVFAVYTYVSATLTHVSGLALAAVALVLAGFGMTAGDVVGSKLADIALTPAIAGVLLGDVAIGTIHVGAAHDGWTAAAALFLVGCGFAILPALRTRLMDVAADAQTLAAALNHPAFDVVDALGGVAIAAGYGRASTGWVAAALPALGLMAFGVSALLGRSRA